MIESRTGIFTQSAPNIGPMVGRRDLPIPHAPFPGVC